MLEERKQKANVKKAKELARRASAPDLIDPAANEEYDKKAQEAHKKIDKQREKVSEDLREIHKEQAQSKAVDPKQPSVVIAPIEDA